MTVAVLSGGLDSTVLVGHLLEHGHEVTALSVNYGQRHSRELRAAANVAEHYGIHHVVLPAPELATLLGGSALTSPHVPVPDGHYAEDSMKATIVPNRNAILLSMAAGYAFAIGHNAIGFGAHAGDHPVYPDCRPGFVTALEAALVLGSDWPRGFSIHAPFLTVDKTEIVRIGRKLGAPLHLTWSCYKGGLLHCGTCGTCTERREAFELAGAPDPTRYRAAA
jgi:7-cyano-7-deazaguanine synthase